MCASARVFGYINFVTYYLLIPILSFFARSMPPPPPPSASYLLKFDTDSEDDDDVDIHEEMRRRIAASISNGTNNGAVSKQSNETTIAKTTTNQTRIPPTILNDENKEEEEEEQSPPLLIGEEVRIRTDSLSERTTESNESTEESVTASPTTTTTKKKKRRKRNRRKKKSASTAKEEEEPTPLAVVKKSVRFDTVSCRLYQRTLGQDGGVPADGGWPLGMTNDYVQEPDMPLDTVETAKQERLQKRWKILYEGDAAAAAAAPPLVLETRPFDYKSSVNANGRSVKNRLFGPLREDQRIQLLCGGRVNQDNGGSSSNSSCCSNNNNKKNKKNTSPKKKNKKKQVLPSNSTSSSSPSSSSSCCAKGSCGGDNNDEKAAAVVVAFDSVTVRHVRNELEQIRHWRTHEGSNGCTCRKLCVYLPPKNSGKKAQHKRLSERRVKEELRKRNALPPQTMTRAQLEHLLHDLVEQEPCCSVYNNCPCVVNGLGCQADCCSCWHDSHQTLNQQKKRKDSMGNDNDTPSSSLTELSAQAIQQRCGNRNGMYAVDFDTINAYRKDIIRRHHHQQQQQQQQQQQEPTTMVAQEAAQEIA